MERKPILGCVLVAMLGIGAMIAGFVAEATKLKPQLKVVDNLGLVVECEYPSSQALVLAIFAAIVALVLARAIIISATGGCCSCCKALPNLCKLGRLCIILSWITHYVAIILFLYGAKYSTKKGVERVADGKYRCYALSNGIFFGAGIVGLVSVIFGLAYYLFYVSAQNGAAKTSSVDQELEAPPITDDGKKPQVP